MRSNISKFELKVPQDLPQALQILEEAPSTWTPFAGGTDLMVLFEAGQLTHKKYLNLWGIPQLKGISEDSTHITIGALTTYTQLRENLTLQKEFPNLCQAASETGAISIQNRGTLGGNIANASPAADSPPALLTYEAEIELLSKQGSRWVSYADFHTTYKKTVRRPDELISKIRLARHTQQLNHYYRKVGTRKAQAISKVCLAAVIRIEQGICAEVRIAMGSIAPIPFRCSKTESCLTGQKITSSLIQHARQKLAQEIKPIDDIRSTSEYRLRVSQNLLEDFIRKAAVNVELDQ